MVVGVRSLPLLGPPALGLSVTDVEAAHKWIRGQRNRPDPPHPPILSPETVGDRLVPIARMPASEMQPHRAPAEAGGRARYWVRGGVETVHSEQRGDLLRGLMPQTARAP